jgi:hypothetical protein
MLFSFPKLCGSLLTMKNSLKKKLIPMCRSNHDFFMVTYGESVFYLMRRIVPPYKVFSPHFDYNYQSKYPFLSKKGPRGDVALDLRESR